MRKKRLRNINYRKANNIIQKIYYSRHRDKAYIKNNISGALSKTYSEQGQSYKMELSLKTGNSLKP